ncbi:MAG: hypothetical protein ACOZNI_34270 [Myxococcota bacterium]
MHHDTPRDVAEGLAGAAGMLLALVTPMFAGFRAHWGVTAEVAARSYPGDVLIPTPRWGWTHGVEIEAPPEDTWPWVAQIGQGHAGFYSYQFLENVVGCDVENADTIHPEWEARSGDQLRLHPGVRPLPFVGVEPGWWMLAYGRIDVTDGARATPRTRPEDVAVVSWLFHLALLGGTRTRFVSRFRTVYGDTLAARLAMGPSLLEPVGFVMDRRMLLGVKARVENAARGTLTASRTDAR